MQTTTDTLTSDDGFPLHRIQWRPDDGEPKAVVQLLHGLAEHAARYARLAEALTAAGYAVVGVDARGHGQSVRDERDRGHFADDDGWSRAIADVAWVRDAIGRDFPGCPVVLLGHSMGSSLALWAAAAEGDRYVGMLLSGPTGTPNPLIHAGTVITRFERWRLGGRRTSALLHRLSFGDFNKGFEGRTEHDWLSRDPAEVDAYVADPWCGFVATTQHWFDHLHALKAQSEVPFLARIPHTLPIHVIVGDRDPVSGGGARVRTLLARMTTAGLTNVTSRFYEDARHELFNETNREEVTAGVIAWLDGVIGRR